MKKLSTFLVLLLFLVGMDALAQKRTMQIHKGNTVIAAYDVSEIDSVTFVEKATTEEITGSVDLPSSVKADEVTVCNFVDNGTLDGNNNYTVDNRGIVFAHNRDKKMIYVGIAGTEGQTYSLNAKETAIFFSLISFGAILSQMESNEDAQAYKDLVYSFSEVKILETAIQNAVKQRGYLEINDVANELQAVYTAITDEFQLETASESSAAPVQRSAPIRWYPKFFYNLCLDTVPISGKPDYLDNNAWIMHRNLYSGRASIVGVKQANMSQQSILGDYIFYTSPYFPKIAGLSFKDNFNMVKEWVSATKELVNSLFGEGMSFWETFAEMKTYSKKHEIEFQYKYGTTDALVFITGKDDDLIAMLNGIICFLDPIAKAMKDFVIGENFKDGMEDNFAKYLVSKKASQIPNLIVYVKNQQWDYLQQSLENIFKDYLKYVALNITDKFSKVYLESMLGSSIDEFFGPWAMALKITKAITTPTCTVLSDRMPRVIIDFSNYSSDPGVVINGIRWATRNVDAPGTFAFYPESAGMFYQWNRKIGWTPTDPLKNSNGGTAWNSTIASGSNWEAANNPCPAGWRVPTRAEQQSLCTASSKWTTQNGVWGRLFGVAPNTLFFPAVGYRDVNGTLNAPSVTGYYWSNMSVNNGAYFLALNNVVTDIYSFDDRRQAMTIRCVDATVVSYTITASAGANGTISPSGSVSVTKGGSQTFTFAPNSGYVIDKVLVDGTSNASAVSAGSYTFSNVSANHTISVSFTQPAQMAVSTDGHSGVVAKYAWLHGHIISNGNREISDRGFVLSTEPDPTHSTVGGWVQFVPPVEGENINSGSFECRLVDLSPCTTYYYAAFAQAMENGQVVERVFGEVKSFTTQCETGGGSDETGVLINGITWATRNVDAPGTFAATPESAGMFYQWNRKIGWSSSDPMVNSNGGTTWDSYTPSGTEWEATNDPCPSGWRVPTIEELQSLIDAGRSWTTQHGVTGRIGGSGSNNLFLPAAGCRSGIDGKLSSAGTYGNYWSGTQYDWTGTPQYDSNFAYNLCFYTVSLVCGNDFRIHGYSVRCLAE
jgi:uncharacterized protein (TIGR02145 family)